MNEKVIILFVIILLIIVGVRGLQKTDSKKLLELIKQSKNVKQPLTLFTKPLSISLLEATDEDLSETYLMNTELKKIKLKKIEALELNWTNIHITGGEIINSRLALSTLTNVTFENVYFKNFNIAKSVFNGVTFKNCVIEDERGAHIFYKSFNGITGTTVKFIDTKIRGMMLAESILDISFENSDMEFVELSLKYPSKLVIKDSNGSWLDGDRAFLQSLSIDNSHFKKSKFNKVNIGEVSLSKLKGRLPVTGNLGNVKVDRLETDESYLWGGYFYLLV